MSSYEFVVKRSQQSDIGRSRARIHIKRRGADRYAIVLLKAANGAQAFVSALGHDEEEREIWLDFDVRQQLGAKVDHPIQLTISPAGFLGKLSWYLGTSDPAVRIPAWLAVWSVALGAAGVVLGVVSLCK